MSARITIENLPSHRDWNGAFVLIDSVAGVLVAVRDAEGRTAIFPVGAVDVGNDYFLNGLWLRESDPRVLDQLERDLRAELQVQQEWSINPESAALIEECKRVLLRNGRSIN